MSESDRPDCPTCDGDGTVTELPEAGYWTCEDCGERGSGREEPIWWRNDPESIWYAGGSA